MTKNNRLYSLDALRGFDMFWITGGEELFHALAKATAWGWAITMSHQLTHVEWDGFRFYDLIFPMFLFMAGVSTPFSLGSRLEKGDDKRFLLKKVIRRGLILVLLGIIYNNGLTLKPLSEIRFPSVLGRIGLACMFAQIIYLYAKPKYQYYWFAGVLLGYWALLMLVPVPNCEAGVLTMDCNLTSYIDRLLLPGRLHRIIHDPEGLLSTIPAVGTALLGIFAGNLLRTPPLPPHHNGRGIIPNNILANKTLALVVLGVVCLAVGWTWDLVFAVNKNLWTSSFTLVAGGWSLLFLALFYFIIDIKGFKRWAFVFTIIGMNSILIYMAQHFIDFGFTGQRFLGGVVALFPPHLHETLSILALILAEWAFLYFLYKKKVFLKV